MARFISKATATQMQGWLFNFYLTIEDHESYDLLNLNILQFKQTIKRELFVADIEA